MPQQKEPSDLSSLLQKLQALKDAPDMQNVVKQHLMANMSSTPQV